MSITRRLAQAELRLSRRATPAPVTLDPVELFRRAVGSDPDTWQADVLRSQAGRVLMLCSRQSGKSQTTAVIALAEALYNPGSLTLLLAPAWRQSAELFRKLTDAYNALGQPVPAKSATATSLELVNGSRVVSLPGQEGTIRGFSGVDLLVIDEAARVPDELYLSVRPMLAVSGGRLVALSTPWGRRGWLYEAWHSSEDWQRVRVTALDVPRITAAFLAEEKRNMPRTWYDSEYMCVFSDTVEQVFSSEDIHAALDPTLEPLFPSHKWEG